MNRKEKLDIISQQESVKNIEWQNIQPDNNHDWINQRDEKYENYNSITDVFNKK